MTQQAFADFTTSNYRRLLGMARDVYRFVQFDDEKPDENAVLWRHDIDFSVNRALKLARIEQGMDITSTYFVQIGTMFYNVFEEEMRTKLLQILDMGHTVGLHFNPGLYKPEEVVDGFMFEKEILRHVLDAGIQVFSLHNPDQLSASVDLSGQTGLINAYDFTDDAGWEYCSDSNGYWRFDPLEEILKTVPPNNLQVLTHPAWWQDEPMPPRARIKRCAEGRAAATMSSYDKKLRSFGRKNVGK
ncbi:MAG: hypothetical protein KGZ25_08915 [Planctomycetes bacterium]|nr:hypothetical protein [Planctomycetota bacterium]